MVRAKFRCVNKETLTEGFKVNLQPVTYGSEENEKFFRYTPFGMLEMGTINAEAAAQFEVGKEYYIDISEA